jgi:hypothetical protein
MRKTNHVYYFSFARPFISCLSFPCLMDRAKRPNSQLRLVPTPSGTGRPSTRIDHGVVDTACWIWRGAPGGLDLYRPPSPVATWHDPIGPYFSFKFKFNHLNAKTSRFDSLRSKKLKTNSKNSNFISHPPINIVWGPKKFKTSHLFYVLYFNFLSNYFLKFLVHEMNSKIVKSRIVVLTEGEKTDILNVTVS